MAEPDYDALAKAVVHRRKVLGLHQQDLQSRGGPHRRTVVRTESGWYRSAQTDISSATLDSLDTALQWVPGSAARTLLSGEQPIPIEAASEASDRDRLAQFRTWHETLGRIGDRVKRGVDLDAVTDDIRQLSTELGKVVDATERAATERRRREQGAAFTHILEELRRSGQSLSLVMETAFAEHLRNHDEESERDRDEVLYRLWLLGRATVPEDIERRFDERFHGGSHE